ncbi:MAG: polyprenol monophosphomannose synthase [Ktedonobacterales bacterium]
MKTLIVIPTYNERGNIERLVDDILRTVPSVDVLIIDDNSPDGTGQIADALHARLPQISVLHRQGKLGLGTAYIRGFQYAMEQGYDLVFEMDADFSHDPRYLPAFLRAAQEPEAADLVIGSRYIPGGDTPNWSALRKFISGGGNIFARAVLRIPIHDCTSGFRCYRTAALSLLNLGQVHSQGYAFQVEMAYAMWKSGYRLREVPIVFEDRRVGQSKMSRRIFIEAFTWVLSTRLRGSPVVRQRTGARPASSPVAGNQPASELTSEAASGRQ